MTSAKPTRPKTPRPRYGGLSIALAVVFGILYAYILWSAIGNLIDLPKELAGADVPWAVLVLDVALPAIAFAAAFWIGRKHPFGARFMLFLMGLVLLACSTVGSIAFVQTH
jgi:hypothetical protein